MKLTCLGGASGPGTSGVLADFGAARVLVDGGGQWVGAEELVPTHLRPLEQLEPPDAIVVTHAHPDRIGGLERLHYHWPHVPVYMTAPTRAFVARSCLGSAQRGEAEQQEQQVAAELLIGATRTLSFGQMESICQDRVQLTLYPAGHVMGAAMVMLASDVGSVLLTGDITATDQKTVPGMMMPSLMPDAVVVESTYGGSLYASRAAEELRLLDQVQATLSQEQGGALVFPTLALGRAQELFLILAQAMVHEKIPLAPIFVDGKIRQICDAFGQFPLWMTGPLRSRTRRVGHPFFAPKAERMAIQDEQHRRECLVKRPAIFLVDSMAEGGALLHRAVQQIATEPSSALMLSSYQDEESLPTSSLTSEGGWCWGGEQIELACRVERYRLSAHADTAQIVGMVERLRPRDVILVQGTQAAKDALKRAFEQAGGAQIHRPVDGDELSLKGTTQAWQQATKEPTRGEQSRRRLRFDDLPELEEILLAQSRSGRLYTVQEVLLAWGDAEGAQDEREIERVGRFLGARQSPMKRDRKRPHLFRLRAEAKGPQISKKQQAKNKAASDGPMDPFNALKEIDAHLSEQRDGLYKRSVHKQQQRLSLSFYFPQVAEHKYTETLAMLAEKTGWKIEIRAAPHQEMLIRTAMEFLPEDWVLKKRPSIRLQEQKVVLQLELPPPLDEAQRCADLFVEKTGFQLEFKDLMLASEAAADGVPSDGGGEGEMLALPDALGGEFVPDVKPAPAAQAPLEINKAYQVLRDAFRDAPQPLLKVGCKGDVIEVSFISPQVGARYSEVLEVLSGQIGWPVRVRQHADQHRIKQLAKQLIPSNWGIKKEPGIHTDVGEVRIVCSACPSEAERLAVYEAFARATGFRLSIKVVL